MVTQPTPNVTSQDVERIVHRDFPANQAKQVLSVLFEYGSEDWHRETERVRVAALKLAAGDLDQLQKEIAIAKIDYRDVLAPAEYPEYHRRVDPSANTSSDERQKIIEADWKQYSEWLSS